MADIIKVDFRRTWRQPVFVRIGNGFRDRITGPDDALDALNRRWPATQGAEYSEAKKGCIDALRQRGSAEVARDRFVEAAVKAGVLG